MPIEIIEVILTTLTLLELARVSATCRTFQALYRRRLVGERKARKELATTFFGGDQITRLIAFIVQVLEGASLDLDRGVVDKKLNPLWCPPNGPHYGRLARNNVPGQTSIGPNEIRLDIRPKFPGVTVDSIAVYVGDSQWSQLDLLIRRNGMGVWLRVRPNGDNELEGVGLVQAILDGGLAQYVQDGGKWVRVEIEGLVRYQDSESISRLGMKTQIAPLLAAGSRYTSEHDRYPTVQYCLEQLHIGQE